MILKSFLGLALRTPLYFMAGQAAQDAGYSMYAVLLIAAAHFLGSTLEKEAQEQHIQLRIADAVTRATTNSSTAE